MTYAESIEYMNDLLKFGIRPQLDRISALSGAFGNPHKQLKVIHVAGTNGKGSTSTFIASILREAGYRVGLYLSPYVHDIRERIQIDGNMISKDDFAAIITEIKPAAEKIAATKLGPVTEFEVKTMAAYLHFAHSQVDFAIIEVGMGGRFDATNIVEPLVAVITNISLDHTERLGDTVEKIAFEKSGIIKTGTVLVTATDDDAAWKVILSRCRKEGAEVWRVMSSSYHVPNSPSADVQMRYTSKDSSFSLRGGGVEFMCLTPGLRGKFQHINAATAIAAIKALEKYEVRISPQAVVAGVANATIPGRLQVLRENPTVVIDGAHNPGAARNLAQSMREDFKYDRLILVLGMLNTHSADGVLSELAPLATKIIATQSQWIKATSAFELADAARKFCADVEVVEKVSDAVKCALKSANPNDIVLVTGSFTTIGEVNIADA